MISIESSSTRMDYILLVPDSSRARIESRWSWRNSDSASSIPENCQHTFQTLISSTSPERWRDGSEVVVYTEKHESPNSGKSDFTLFGLNQKSRQSPISFQFRFLLELESIHHEPYIYVARSLFIYSMIPDRQFGRSFGVEAVRTAGWRGRSILDYIPKPLKSLCEFFEKSPERTRMYMSSNRERRRLRQD